MSKISHFQGKNIPLTNGCDIPSSVNCDSEVGEAPGAEALLGGTDGESAAWGHSEIQNTSNTSYPLTEIK